MTTLNSEASDFRFRFGENWISFLSVVDEDRIAQATARLSEALGDLKGKSFLDIGCGNGIHSLAALHLGASRIVSFDYDRQSVECTLEIKRRYARDSNWRIEQGSVLDEPYLRSLGKFDVVYSWGVLHHTGNMWKALELAVLPTGEKLMIAIYNDQGWKSRFWTRYKRLYNLHGTLVQKLMQYLVFTWAWAKPFVFHPRATRERWKNYAHGRGMSPWHDVVDWAGGYPFEVATPAQLVNFFEERGFVVQHSLLNSKGGCNEFVFRRKAVSTE